MHIDWILPCFSICPSLCLFGTDQLRIQQNHRARRGPEACRWSRLHWHQKPWQLLLHELSHAVPHVPAGISSTVRLRFSFILTSPSRLTFGTLPTVPPLRCATITATLSNRSRCSKQLRQPLPRISMFKWQSSQRPCLGVAMVMWPCR